MSTNGVKKSSTVLKALKMLEETGKHANGISLTEIATVAELDRSTAYRLLATLVEAGYLVRSEETKKYRLSYKLVSISRLLLAATGPDDLIRETLADLSRRTQETANFSVLDGQQAVIRLQSKGSHLLSVAFKVGDRSHLHCTSIGKVLLAQQGERFIQDVLSRPLPKVAPKTITDPNELRIELEKIRINGYALDVLEFAEDMCCVAAPIFGPKGKLLGGINFAGPRSRFSSERMEELAKLLLQATQGLSDAMHEDAAQERAA
jgi:IclR family KDG regulon transcriptional repressor